MLKTTPHKKILTNAVCAFIRIHFVELCVLASFFSCSHRSFDQPPRLAVYSVQHARLVSFRNSECILYFKKRLAPSAHAPKRSKALRDWRAKRVNSNETFITNLVQKPESLEFDCKGNTFVLNTQILIIFFDKRIRIYIYFLSVINICRDIFLKTLKPFLYQWYIL